MKEFVHNKDLYMSNKPLVSVIIPTYSRPVFLKRCLDSVLNQTYPNIEVFVVDDNNPDTDARSETEKTMEAYKENPRVTYLKHEKNKNGSAARNTGWKASHGEYITFPLLAHHFSRSTFYPSLDIALSIC